MFVLPWGGKERGQSNLSNVYSLSPPIKVTVLSWLTYVKRDELGFRIQVSNDIQALLSQTSSRKNVGFFSVYSAAQCIYLSIFFVI